jgi:hypothetical protein
VYTGAEGWGYFRRVLTLGEELLVAALDAEGSEEQGAEQPLLEEVPFEIRQTQKSDRHPERRLKNQGDDGTGLSWSTGVWQVDP